MVPLPLKYLYTEAFDAALNIPDAQEYLKDAHLCFITATGLISGIRMSDKDTGLLPEIIKSTCNSIENTLEKINGPDSEPQNHIDISGNAIALKDVTISAVGKTYHLDSMVLFTDDIIGITCMSGNCL